MDAKTRAAIENVVAYLWDEEADDYENADYEGPHIFESLQTLREFLDSPVKTDGA